MQHLQEIAGLPAEHFETFYLRAIRRFAECVQSLPSQANGALQGLLNEGLARGMVALQYHLHEYSEQSQDPLLLFSIFTAGLCRDLGKLITNQRVVLTKEDGEFLSHWNPFEGSMMGQAEFYKAYPQGKSYQRLNIPATYLLARQVLGKQGFLWLRCMHQVGQGLKYLPRWRQWYLWLLPPSVQKVTGRLMGNQY